MINANEMRTFNLGKQCVFLTIFILQDSRNFKKTLLQLERLYYILIDVEDCEKKLAVLPTGTPLRSQVETDGKEGIRYLGQQLVREDKLRLYITVRKGKALLIRALRWLNASQMRVVCATLFQNYPLAVKKDRDDKLHCGGAIASSNRLISAGHCFVDQVSKKEMTKSQKQNFKVQVGTDKPFESQG